MARDIGGLRRVAAYQFGAGAGRALFPREGDLSVDRSRSGRPRQVSLDGERLVSFGRDGRFTLGVAGGRRLLAATAAPHNRVVVGDDSEPL